MKDTKEIVLFFKENTKFTPLNIAQELLSRYPELGNPIILPETSNKNAPLVVFNENDDIQMQTNYNCFTFVCNHKYFDNITSIIFDIVDTLEGEGAEFNRIGYVASIFLSPKYVDKAKDKYLNMEELNDIEEVNVSWYRKLGISTGYINCWERIITDSQRFKDLLCQFDFNTPVNIEVSLDMKYIKEFFKICDEFVERRTDI